MLHNLRRERHANTPNTGTPGASPEAVTDLRFVYPLTLRYNGRMGGPYILYAESAQARNEWKQKLDEALGSRKVDHWQESNNVFEVGVLDMDTFMVSPFMSKVNSPFSWSSPSTGKVTCSVPFSKVAIWWFWISLLNDF